MGLILLVLALFAVLGLMIIDKDTIPENNDRKIINSCSGTFSCLCRDTCANIYGHSDYNSWLNKYDKEYWCIEQNGTKRIF